MLLKEETLNQILYVVILNSDAELLRSTILAVLITRFIGLILLIILKIFMEPIMQQMGKELVQRIAVVLVQVMLKV